MPNYDGKNIAQVYEENRIDFENQQKSMQDNTPIKEAFSAFLKELGALNEQIGKHCVREQLSGLYPDFTDKDRDELLKTYDSVREKLNTFIMLPDKSPAFKQLKKTLTEFPNIIATDMRILSGYQPEKEMLPLPHILSRARIHTVDTESANMNKADGGAMSSRIPLIYTDAGGNKLQGFFTAKSVIDTSGDYAALLKEAKEKFPDLSHTLDSLADSFIPEYNKTHKKPFDGSPAQRHELIFSMIMHHFDDKTVSINKDKLYDFISDCRQKNASYEIPEDLKPGQKDPRLNALVELLAKPMRAMHVSTYMNKSIGVVVGDRVDSRNSAMSAVADMLGKRDLLARSIPMQLKINGQLVEGTFMESAKGVDPLHADEDAMQYTEYNFSGKGLRAMADLQILDYICGNIDRHFGNMMYQFSAEKDPESRSLENVQGIDNDLSFGLTVPKDRNEGRKEMAAISNMKVISESMAGAVLSLRPEELVYRLQGLQLTKKQLSAACQRLKLLQDCIMEDMHHFEDLDNSTKNEYDTLMKTDYNHRTTAQRKRIKELKMQRSPNYVEQGRIRVVPDNLFEKFELEKLLPEDKKACNIFSTAKKFVKNRRPDMNKDKKSIYTEFVNKSRVGADSTRQYAQDARDFQQLLKEVTGWRGSSPEFKNLSKALDKYVLFCNDNEGKVMELSALMNRNKFLADLQQKCQTYLDHKKGEKDLNEYAMKRVNAVAKLQLYSKDAPFAPNPEEMQLIRRHEQEQITALNKQFINLRPGAKKDASEKAPEAGKQNSGPKK